MRLLIIPSAEMELCLANGLRGFSVIQADHTFIQMQPDTIRLSLHFLKTGEWEGNDLRVLPGGETKSMPASVTTHVKFRTRLHVILLSLIFLHLVPAVVQADPADAPPANLIVCGMDEVFIIHPVEGEAGKKLWSWRARERPELPEDLRGRFATTDECKPLAEGKRILISSSSGGCALVNYPSGRATWYANVPNAHSIELLPHDRVVVAASVGNDKLVVFDLARPGKSITQTPLESAHGVIWDADRKCLWALGFHDLIAYQLKDWDTETPSLQLVATHPLPDSDGHDLQSVPGSKDLILTTDQHVYLFDRETHEFRRHPELGDKVGVKCISIHPTSGHTAFIQADEPNWWSGTLRFFPPFSELSIKPEHIYKARWCDFPAAP